MNIGKLNFFLNAAVIRLDALSRLVCPSQVPQWASQLCCSRQRRHTRLEDCVFPRRVSQSSERCQFGQIHP